MQKTNDCIKNVPYFHSTTIDLTEHCNLACDYCFTWKCGSGRNRVLKEEIGKRIIDWWLAQGNVEQGRKRIISWWGGEPFLEWELLQCLTLYAEEKAKEGNWEVEFGGTTNGMLYTPEKFEWLVEHKCVMLISLDGIQLAHDSHRKTLSGKGSWKIVDKNTREALKVIPFQRIRSSLSVENSQYFLESVQYFVEELGLDNIAFSPVYEGNWTEKDWEVLEEQFNLAVDYAIKRAKQDKPIVLKHLNDEANINNQLLPAQNPCGAGSGYSGWSIDGYCYPCHRFNKHNQTTTERSKSKLTMASIYDGFINHEWRKSFYEWKEHPSKKCLECSLFRRSTCNGGCYAINFELTGDIYKPLESLCRFTELQHRAGLRYAELAAKEKVKILASGWGENIPGVGQQSCICYNMCYAEGTDYEVTHVDYSNDSSCLCYQTNYSGESTPQFRVINHEIERLKKKFLSLSKDILRDRHRKKSKEHLKLENEVIEKTIKLLEGSQKGQLTEEQIKKGGFVETVEK